MADPASVAPADRGGSAMSGGPDTSGGSTTSGGPDTSGGSATSGAPPASGGSRTGPAGPATGALAALYNECVHCGFCLPACPTYEVLGTEMDSPRGRLHLMHALETGRPPSAEPIARHLDLCLGCRACETECPSGVPFGEHLERARERLRGDRLRPLATRLLEGAVLRGVALPAWAHRAGAGFLRALVSSGLARVASRPPVSSLLPRRLVSALSLLDAASPRAVSLSARIPAKGTPRLRAGLLQGCVSRWVAGPINAAAARLLSASGVEVLVPAGQRCCGALHLHAGDRDGARRLARANIAAFEEAGALDAIVVTSAGCGSAMKSYGALFVDDPEWRDRAAVFAARVRDALEVLAETGPPQLAAPAKEEGRPDGARVAYHDACHLAHVQGVRAQPRALLASIPGLTLVPLADADRCCGSAGIYNLLHPDVAGAILDAKILRLRESGATIVAAANPGCLLQIAAGVRRAGLPIRVAHPLEILDEATRRT